MVQVLPETSNQNIWQQAARDATVGYFEGTKIKESREKERQKKALFAAATDPNKTPIDRTKAMEQYVGEYGEIGDVIKFQKEQGRMSAMNNIKELLGRKNNPQATTGNLGLGGEQNNGPPPATAENLGLGNNQQQAPIDNRKLIDDALLDLTQYDPASARTISDVLNRDQKADIAQQNQDIKKRTLDVKEEQFRQNKIIPIQEKAATTIKRTNGLLKAGSDQLAALDSTGVWSAANISQVLSAAGYDTAAKAAQSEGGAIFKTAGKEIITGGLKEAFGARPLGIEFQAYEDMQAQIGRKKEVNELAIKSIMAEPTIQNEVAKYQMQLIADNPNISPIELNTKSFKYEEEVTDRVFKEWEEYRDRALESMKQKSSWFGLGKTPTQQKKETPQPESWKDLWK